MTETMLKRQIRRYGNDAVRFKQKADSSYAAWKTNGNKNDYLNSQRYYEASKRAEEVKKNYEIQLMKLK